MAHKEAPRIGRALLQGLVLGAAFGALEMALRIETDVEPSVARRAAGLVVYGAWVNALLFGAVFFVVALLARLLRGRASDGLSQSLAGLSLVGLLVALGVGTWTVRDTRDDFEPPRVFSPLPPNDTRPNVVLVVVDTLRADALGCYGAEGARTPNIDALAARGTLFENVVAPTSWTLPSMATLFTGTFPWNHGFVDFDRRMPEGLAGLPELLADAGYHAQAFVGNYLLSLNKGFDAGFHLYDVYGHELEQELFAVRLLNSLLRRAELVDYENRSVLPWLDLGQPPFFGTRLSGYTYDEDLNARVRRFARFDAPGPELLYVHYVAPHTPYLAHPLATLPTSPELSVANAPELERRYAGEVAYTDRVLGELMELLEREGMLEDALVVLTSDHGEEFGEHGGLEHGTGLYQEVLHVPLIVCGPGIEAGARIAERVQLMDVAPTLLELCGVSLPDPEAIDGRSFVSLLAGTVPGEAPAPSFGELRSRYLTPGEGFACALGDRFKVIRRRDDAGELLAEEVYDLESDPAEANALESPAEAQEGPREEAIRGLKAQLDVYEDLQRKAGEGTLSPADEDRMKALGYGSRR